MKDITMATWNVWMDDVTDDLRSMGIRSWPEKARNRDQWRLTAGRPRPTQDCSAEQKKMNECCYNGGV
jgi:hypothetical protein